MVSSIHIYSHALTEIFNDCWKFGIFLIFLSMLILLQFFKKVIGQTKVIIALLLPFLISQKYLKIRFILRSIILQSPNIMMTQSCFLTWKGKTRVTSYESRVQIPKLRVQVHELQVQIHELRVQILELWVQIHELED